MKKPPKMTNLQKVTFDTLVTAHRAKLDVPPGAWTLKAYMAKTGYSQAQAHKLHAKLVADGSIRKGGPKSMYYWPA